MAKYQNLIYTNISKENKKNGKRHEKCWKEIWFEIEFNYKITFEMEKNAIEFDWNV